jgi:CDP-glycerol glycerophosphotransferase (TagB/SpsB family)
MGSEIGNNLFVKKTRGVINRSNNIEKSPRFFKKHLFLIRTQLALGWNIFQIMKDIIFFVAVYFPIIYKNPDYMPKFELDRIFVQSNKTIQKLVALGFNKSKLVSTGDPSYDEFFQLLETSKKSNTQKNKKNILILTTILFGESRKNVLSQRRFFVEEIIKAIPRNEFEIIIKIHPTLENLKDYTNIVEPINSSVNVTQNANLVELILNADIIITPVSGTSAVCALIARKPIIIWNVFNVENDALIQNELALPCKDQKMILEQIRKAEIWLPNEEKIKQFTREYLHASDGKASERTAVEIVNFLKRRKPHLF